MQHWRCKCGKATAFGSDWPKPCQGCKDCNTTLEQHPQDHKVPEPHKFDYVQYNQDTGEKEIYCSRCLIKKE